MLTKEAKKELTKQQYRVIGSHSAVKVCGWTRKFLKGEGGCYKYTFYGIKSHQCMQMTTSVSCANRCIFCWRGYKAPVSKEWKWDCDEPEYILENSQKFHHLLISGFGGNERAAKELVKEAKKVKHVALSLTGEPIIYPKINELIDLFHSNGISTFMVSNAQHPEEIKKLKPVTQLYLSVDAPTKVMLKEIDKPLFVDYWERMITSLKELSKKKQRTCIRLTLLKGVNMNHAKEYADLIKIGDPDFIEPKAYMFVGASRQKLSKENMPYHEDVVLFAKELLVHLPEYKLVMEHKPSRVVLLAKKKFFKKGRWQTWIDFDKFFALAKSGKDFSTKDYLKETPKEFLMDKT